jgi:hypothetical protein
MRNSWKTMVLLACVCGFLLPSAVLAQHLALDKGRFAPGEPIRVRFTASAGYADNAWVGIIPSTVAHGKEAVNDRYDLTYQYLRKRTGGTLTFKAPQKPGAYDFRMHDTDSNGREVASVSFTVGPAAPPAPPAPAVAAGRLQLDKGRFAPSEQIRVRFTASAGYADNAWVGIIPSTVAHGKEAVNDRYDLTYQYLRKRTGGTLTFTAPRKPGAYDFRMHDTDSNGREVASVSFTVASAALPAPTARPVAPAAGSGSLRLDQFSFAPGTRIEAHFTASAGYADNAWVGIIPSSVPHGREAVNDRHDLTYQYLRKRTGGTLVFQAPRKPGNYDLRMHDTDSNGREVANVAFTVTP